MENIQNKGEQDPKDKLAEEEALKEVKDEDIRFQVIEKYGLNESTDSELITKLTDDFKEEHKKLSTAIRQKIDWRGKAQSPKEENKEAKPLEPGKKVEFSEEDLDKKVDEKLNERDLASMDLSDNLKSEVKAYAKTKGISYREALKSDYFSFIKGKENERVRAEEASASSKGKSIRAKRDFGNLSEEDINDLSPEDFKEYKVWLKAQG